MVSFAVNGHRVRRLMHFSRGIFFYTRVVRDERALIIRLRDLVFARVMFPSDRCAYCYRTGRDSLIRAT